MNEPATLEEAKDAVLGSIQWTPHTLMLKVLEINREYDLKLLSYHMKVRRRKDKAVVQFKVDVTCHAESFGWAATMKKFQERLCEQGWRVSLQKKLNIARLIQEYHFRVEAA